MISKEHDFFEEELPFPRRTIQSAGGPIEIYEIPEKEKKAVLEKLCPFRPIPGMGKLMEDIHAEKNSGSGNSWSRERGR